MAPSNSTLKNWFISPHGPAWLRLTAQFSLAQLNTNWSNRFCTVQRQPFESYRFFFHFFLLLVYVSVCDQRAIDPDALFPCVFCVFKWSCTALFRSKHMSVVEIKSDEHFRLHTLLDSTEFEWVSEWQSTQIAHTYSMNQPTRTTTTTKTTHILAMATRTHPLHLAWHLFGTRTDVDTQMRKNKNR